MAIAAITVYAGEQLEPQERPRALAERLKSPLSNET